MQCAISGETPQEPVVSKKSGNVFEKRLIEAYVAEHHKDPITNEDLENDDLIALQQSRTVKPRPPTFTSVPSMLSAFQNEWDALMLESFELKRTVTQLKQELSHALYNQDASVRVIARLNKERNEARDALSKMNVGQLKGAPVQPPGTNGDSTSASASNSVGGDSMQVDQPYTLPDEQALKVEEFAKKISGTRRKRPVPDGWSTAQKIHDFNVSSQAAKLVPGGSTAFAMDTRISQGGTIVFVGGNDGSMCIHNLPKDETLRVFQPSDEAVTGALCIDFQNKFQSAASLATGEVKIFDAENELASFAEHSGPANAIALHPSRQFLVSVGDDKAVILYDVTKKQMLAQFQADAPLTTCEFHPDGLLLAVGSKNGTVSIYQTKTGGHAHTFKFSGPISDLSFSENGMWLAVAVKNSPIVEVVTLTKMNTVHTLDFGEPVDAIEWDYTGQYLVGGGPSSLGVHAYDKAAKSWSQPLKKTMSVKAVHWGPSAKGLVVLMNDGALTIVR